MNIHKSEVENGFNPLQVILPVAVILLLISSWIQWYSNKVSIPSYCKDPVHTLDHLEKIINEARPAGDNPRWPYLITAKLLFLVPRMAMRQQMLILAV